MGDPTQPLERWREAGLLADEQVAAIRAFERERAAERERSEGPVTTDGSPGPGNGDDGVAARDRRTTDRATDRRATAVEAIGYVGGALAIGAIALLLAEVWDELAGAARLSTLALVTLLLAGAGVALRDAAQSPMQRLAATLLGLAVGGVAWSISIAATDVGAWGTRPTALVASAGALLVAVAFHGLVQRTPVQIAMLAAVVATVISALSQPALPPDLVWYGSLLWAVGIAWLLLGRGGWLVPRRPAEVLGGLLALVALQGASFDDARTFILALAVVTAATLVGIALAVDGVHHLVVGAVGLFVFVPQLAFELFGDAIGAPATLLVVGLLLVVVAVGLGRAHREVREEGRA